MEDIILIGYGGHAKSVADSIERTKNYNIIGYTDQCEQSSPYTYLGTDEVLFEYFNKGIKKLALCVGYLGKGNVREELYKKYKEFGFIFPSIIDPSAIIANNVQIGEGSFIGKGVVLNNDVKIGKMCIINTSSVVEHECEIEDFVHLSVAAVLCGQVKVGMSAFIGANATVIQCMRIKNRELIPAGAVVRK